MRVAQGVSLVGICLTWVVHVWAIIKGILDTIVIIVEVAYVAKSITIGVILAGLFIHRTVVENVWMTIAIIIVIAGIS